MDTKHSMAEAARVQRAFEEQFSGREGVLGIGIGLNSSQNDLALNVFVAEQEQAEQLPAKFDGLDVVVGVVGEFRAF